MEESMSDYVAIAISGIAVLISILAYWQTNPLVRMQKESAKLDLEQRTQVKLTIALRGVLDYSKPNSVVVQNTGAVDAYNVHVKVWSGENPPEEIRDETTESFPVSVLPPGRDARGVVYLFGQRRLKYRLEWQDKDDRQFTETGVLSL